MRDRCVTSVNHSSVFRSVRLSIYTQKAHLVRVVRLGFALGTRQLGESLRVLQVAEDFGFSADYGKIAGGQGGEVADLGWSVEREIGAKRRLRLVLLGYERYRIKRHVCYYVGSEVGELRIGHLLLVVVERTYLGGATDRVAGRNFFYERVNFSKIARLTEFSTKGYSTPAPPASPPAPAPQPPLQSSTPSCRMAKGDRTRSKSLKR